MDIVRLRDGFGWLVGFYKEWLDGTPLFLFVIHYKLDLKMCDAYFPLLKINKSSFKKQIILPLTPDRIDSGQNVLE